MRSRMTQSIISLIPFSLGSALALLVSGTLPAVSASASETVLIEDVALGPAVAADVGSPATDAADLPPPRPQWVELFVFGDEDAQRWAAEQIVRHDAHDWPDDYRGTFLYRLAPGALVAAHSHHIPPSVTIAQAVLESGWGRSSLAHTYNNLFGVKAMNGHPVVTLNSAEVKDGVRIPMRLRFAVFESWDHAIQEHGALLANDRYARARSHWTDWSTFIRLIAPIYASDPSYAARVSSLIRSYDLDRWDELVITAVDMAATAPEPTDIDVALIADAWDGDAPMVQ